MMNHPAPRFSSFCVGYFSIAVFFLTVAAANGDDALDELVADYRDYELPMPPDRATLSILKWSTGTSNGVPQYRQVLALVVEAKNQGAPDRY